LYKNLREEHQPERAIEALYRMRRAESRHLDSQLQRGVLSFRKYFLRKLRSVSYDFVSGYGMKTARVLRFLLIVLAVFSAANYSLRGRIFQLDHNHSLMDVIYFTCVTITTVGFGDITPKTQLGRAIVSVEAFAGLVVISLFIQAVANRALRSK
ncbi:MAG TPA: potassium channel family protein, partial [Pyrinomonadaceae bacterium]